MKIPIFITAMVFPCLVLACSLAGPREHKVIGIIENIKTDCWVDAVCSMTVSGDVILFGQGRGSETFGELVGFDPSKLGGEEYIGKKVEVFGRKVGSGTSIAGSKKYYIKLLE
jgi:hypothetical protein